MRCCSKGTLCRLGARAIHCPFVQHDLHKALLYDWHSSVSQSIDAETAGTPSCAPFGVFPSRSL